MSYGQVIKGTSLARATLVNLLIGAGITTFYGLAYPSGLTLRRLLSNVAISMFIGLPCQLVVPLVVQRYHSRPFWMYLWVALSAALLATAGAALSPLAVIPLFAAEWSEYPGVFRNVLPPGVGIAVGVSLVGTYMGSLQVQLAQASADREQAERLAAEARLASLESRVHPHFLFNTLNSIAALIPESPERAEEMVTQVSRLLRQSLEASASTVVPLEQELRLVRDYLEIEKARFGSRLRYTIESPNGAAAASIPAFALHVLVENSVKHVVAKRTQGGEIRVSTDLRGGVLHMQVEDDGPGVDTSMLIPGHGLDVLRARLESLYGTRGRLELARNRVSVSVPVKEQA